MKILVAITFLILSQIKAISSCHQLDHRTLLSFHHHISSSPLNWSASTNCCQWQGIHCTIHDGVSRVTHLWLPEKHLSGTITPTLGDLPFLAHINLSHNQFSGPFPHIQTLQTLDLSFNHFSSPLQLFLPPSIQTLDISSNHFNGSFHPSFLHHTFNLISFNISNNTLTGSIPSNICNTSQLVKILDFSMNRFTGPISPGLGQCSNLQVLRAGSNSLSGLLPHDLYNVTTLKEISLHDNQFSGLISNTIVKLPNLTTLELHFNQLSGEIPRRIGLLTNLETLVLHNNTINGTLPPSLMNCTKLKALVVRDNHLEGDITPLDFSKLHNLQVLDLSGNAFTGNIPHTVCTCSSLTAIGLSRNRLVGEVPPCMASLKSLQHLALAKNNLSNVPAALKTLSHCHNLAVLIMMGTFQDEMMPDDNTLGVGFHSLEILALGNCSLQGQIPPWIAKLAKLKRLVLCKNRMTGTIPSWLGAMPSLYTLNLTENQLSGHLPPQLGLMPALLSENNTSSDMSYLQLPFLIDGNRYNRLYNLRRVLAVGSNNLSGEIPQEIGGLEALQALDLSNNRFTGSIPSQLSGLTNLESLNMSGNHLTGEIPESLRGLHFLSRLSVADNDLEGEIPRGGQFDTFPANSFEGNPKLCGFVIKRNCSAGVVRDGDRDGEDKDSEISLYGLPLGLGYCVGVVAVAITLLIKTC